MKEPITDSLGFLRSTDDWSINWCQQQAERLDITLDETDLTIIQSLRAFYNQYDLSPAMRPLVKHLKTTLGSEVGNSIFLMQRYGGSPARTLALLAGLPKPKHCL